MILSQTDQYLSLSLSISLSLSLSISLSFSHNQQLGTFIDSWYYLRSRAAYPRVEIIYNFPCTAARPFT